MRWRTRTIVQLLGARRASRPQLKRDPLGRASRMTPQTRALVTLSVGLVGFPLSMLIDTRVQEAVLGYGIALLGSALPAAAIVVAYRTLARAGMVSWLTVVLFGTLFAMALGLFGFVAIFGLALL